jgi:predicted nucleotidyltransferase
MKNLNDLLKRLLDNDVDFVLIGGFAGVIHGATQVTQDLDICAVLSEDQIEKLRNALKDLSPIHRMNKQAKISFLERPRKGEAIQNLYLETNAGVLDVIQEVAEVGDFKALKQNADEVELFGKRCKVISLDDLIKVKKNLKRGKDKSILEELLAIKKSK